MIMKKLFIAFLIMTSILTTNTIVNGNIVVGEIEAASIKLNATQLTLKNVRSYQLKVTNTKKKVTWKSSNKSVATVSSTGKVTAKKAGKATITAKVAGKTLKCKVTVKNPTIKLNVTSKNLTVGSTTTLKVTGTSKKVIWSTSNKSVGTVSSKGKVTAKKVGTCYIYAKVAGKTLKCKVTVKAKTTNKVTTSKNKTIVINAGHQGKGNSSKEAVGPGSSTKKAKVSSGATGVYSKKKESQINLDVAKKLKIELESRGYKVIMTRTSQNVNISNKERALIGNKNNADAVISLHCDSTNSSSTRGAHTICIAKNNPYYPKLYSKSSSLAKKVISAYCKETGIKSRGVSYRNDLTGLNWSQVPAIYIEMGFLSNKSEDKLLSNSSFQNKCAKGIADGLDQYFK